MRGKGLPAAPMSPWPCWPDGYGASAEDRWALLVLSALRGITPRGLIALALACGSASASLAAIREGRAGSDNDQAYARSIDPEAIAAAADRCGARFVTWASAEYPWQLRAIHDPPAALYVIGRPPPESRDAVAIVGARGCSELGRELAFELARDVGLAGLTIVSGAARGIDAAGHEGALSAGGRTLAVLGCGLGFDYPRGGRDLMRRVREHGTIVSEYAPGTPPSQRSFPARNRIVAGLCTATVVVEGAMGSGSTITAEHAMEFGRDVFAVPGPVTSPLSQVPLQLIRDGATMIRGSEDLLHDLGRDPVLDEVAARVELAEGERRVLELLTGPTLPDRLASTLGVPVPEVVSILMRLELRGFVRSVGGRYEPTYRARPRSD